MAYRRPAVTVIQEFVGLVPALAAFALPSCSVGPAYQIVKGDLVGVYTGTLGAYAYASVLAGAVVDLEEMPVAEVYPATKLPVAVTLKNAVLEIKPVAASGDGNLTAFTDATLNAFIDVLAGDIIVITAGANIGSYAVKKVNTVNSIELAIPVPTVLSGMSYYVKRANLTVVVDRIPSVGNGFTPDASAISIYAGLTSDIGALTCVVLEGDVYADYRALRNDLSGSVKEYARLSDVQAFFGLDQITPQNPLAFALSMMLQNTVTPVNGLGLNGSAVTDEVLSYQAALDVLGLTEMYALAPLTQNPAIHQLFRAHVEQLSQPQYMKERAALISRKLISVETLVDDTVMSTAIAGARTIVATQTDGEHDGAALSTLTDMTASQFLSVNVGDSVTITGGTNVTPGVYTVLTKTNNNTLILSAAFATAGPAQIDVAYFISRKDGVSANGTTFYDRNGTFVSSLVVAGYFVVITAASNVLALGRYAISAMTSEKSFEIAQIPGITSLVSAIEYYIERDLSKTEQATAIAGYSSGIGSRRVANVWPDVLNTPVGQDVVPLPGFYGAVVMAALTTGLPTHQGFTNLSIGGFLGLEHSKGYFTDAQLDVMADGGTMILVQDGAEEPLYIRHQLTTDRSSIKFQEYSVTKNVDFIAKFLRNAFKGYIGQYNIVDTTFDELKTTSKAVIEFLQNSTRLPKIGGVIRSGTLAELFEDPTQIDTIKMRFEFRIPIPLNYLDITLQV